MINTQTLKGNLVNQDYSTAFTLSQGDKGVPFRVELLENGTPYTLQSTDIVTIEWLKPNGNPFLQEGGIKYGTNYIEFTTPEAVAQYSGTGTFNIIITNNNVRKGTIRREYRVVPTSMKPGSVSEDTITDAITELRELSVEIADTVQNNQDLINNNQAATKQDIANVTSDLEEKASKETTKNIQTQVNNLVLGAVGDGNNAEVVQARGSYTLLNERLNKMADGTGLMTNIENLVDDINTSQVGYQYSANSSNTGSYSDGIYTLNNVVENTNTNGWTFNKTVSGTSKIYLGLKLKATGNVYIEYKIDGGNTQAQKITDAAENEWKSYVFSYDITSNFTLYQIRSASAGEQTIQIKDIFVSEIYSSSAKYNNLKENITDLNDKVDIIENKIADKKKTYILLSFDDQTNMYANRFSIMKDYGFKFTFCLNSGMQVNNDFATTEKQTFYDMLAYGCDVAMYGGDRNSTPPAVSDRTQEEWVTWLSPLLTTLNNLGVFPTTYFAPRGEMPENGENALKELGFSLCRCGLYNCDNSYRWIESWSEDRFGVPMVQIQDDNLDTVKGYIDDCITNGWSLSIFTHQVVDSNTSELNCDTIVFKSLLDYIKTKSDGGYCEVVTFQEFLNKNTEKGRDIQHMRDTRRMNYIENKIASL